MSSIQDERLSTYSNTNAFNFLLKDDKQVEREFITENGLDTVKMKNKDEEGQDTDQSVSHRRTFVERYFSKIEPGSLRGSIFAMSSLALGTGCLAIPSQLQYMSLVGGVMIIILSGISAYWSLNIMILSSNKYKTADYSKLVFHVFGKFSSAFLDYTILIYIFGILISYQVLIYNFIGSFIYYCFINRDEYRSYDDTATESGWKTQVWKQSYLLYPIMFGIAIFILIPLCLLKDISRMRIASIAGICIILYSILVVVFEFPFFLHDYLTSEDPEKNKPINWYDISKGFTSELYFFKGAATIFFAFTCHVGAFPVYKSLKNNAMRRIQKVFRRSIVLDCVLYIILGITGYLSVPYNVPPLIIDRLTIFSNDFLMIIGRLGIAITLMLTLPANYNAFRLSMLEQIYGNTEVTNQRNLYITIPTILLSTMVAVLYDKILNYISILGGFCSVVIAFIFPGILYVKTNEYSIKHWKNISSILLVLVLTSIGFTSAGITIKDIISPSEPSKNN